MGDLGHGEVAGKREFMVEFWRRRDIDPTTPVNEYKQEYFRRVEVANAKYRSGKKEGWKTDQGRIFITYGEPTRIDVFQSSENPYHTWRYNDIEGGIEFIFLDYAGYGEMRLVHSTARDEVQDYDWRIRWLR